MKKINLIKHTNFVIAICIPLIALLVQWELWSFIKPFVWFLFYPAVFFSARIAGLKGGIASTLFSTLIVWYFFIPPMFSLQMENTNNLFSIIVFIVVGILISDVQENLKKANLKVTNALNDVRLAHEKVSELYEKSLEADKLKSHFFTNVSHEFRTPLTLILNPVGELLKKNDLDENIRYNLEIIERNSRLLYRHVTDLLDISKLEAKQMRLNYSRIDIVGLTKLITSSFESAAESKRIKYAVTQPEKLIVEIDSIKYQRILQNLLGNAFRFTPMDGMISVDITSDSNNLIIEIQDSGPGIPPEMREKIFERFQQIDRQGVHEYGGTGLGLAIVKEFVELHNGKVIILDPPGNGALFQITFPLKAAAGTLVSEHDCIKKSEIGNQFTVDSTMNRSSDSRQSINQGTSLTSILIVDDNQDITDFLTRTLSPDFLISTASNGKEGLEKALAIKPDLIITDVMMPVLSGDKMVKLMREYQQLEDIPIIMLTAVIDSSLKNDLLKDTVQDFLTKPFSIEELRSKVINHTKQIAKQKTKIAESEHRYHYALDNMLEGCQIVDHDWRYIYINKSASDFGRQTREYFIGKKIFEVFPNIQEQPIFEKLRNCLENKIADHFEIEFVHPDHSIGWYDLSVHPIPEGIFILSSNNTDRKLAEVVLQESEERYRTLFENMLNGFAYCQMLYDGDRPLDFVYLSVNNAFETLTGLKNVVGKKVTEVIPGIRESDNNLFEIYSKVALTGKPETFEIFVSALNEWFSVSVYSPRKEFFIAVFDVITERKNAENQLRENEAKYRSIYENSSIAILLTAPDGRVFSANDFACKIFDRSEEELCKLGRDGLVDLASPSLQPLLDERKRNGKAKGELNLIKKDGTRFPAEVSSVIFNDHEGNERTSMIIRDLTEQKQADYLLVKSEENYRNIFEFAPLAAAFWDIETKIIYWNKAAEKIFGWTKEEVIGKRFIDLFIPEQDREKVEEDINLLINNISRETTLNLNLTKNGNLILCEWNNTIIHDKEGNPSTIISLAKDVTEQKRAEDEIKQLNESLEQRVIQRTSQLEASNDELKAFSYSVSHDLRTPLRHINGFINLFLENRTSKLTEEELGYLKVVTNSAAEMGQLIDALLSFSRLNRAVLRKTDIDTLQCIQHGLQYFEKEIQSRSIKIRINRLHKTYGDFQLIQLVWVNLISNAVKYTAKKENAIIEIGSQQLDFDTVFFIKDNGVGFDMKYKDKLFGVFQRLHKSKDFEGIGIGLANIFRIVTRHGGRCWAEGETDKGATFYFSLPVKSNAES